MGIIYLVVGGMILFWGDFPIEIPVFRTGFGVLVFAFGVFRLFRVYKQQAGTK